MRKLFHYLVCICFIMILLVGLVPTVSADTNDSSEDMITVLSTDDDDDIYVYNGAVYELSDDREADYIRPKNKKQKSVVIPATIKKNGKTYRVTAIEDNAFKGITKYTTIKVPKSKHSAYKKLFRNHGLSTKVSVKGY